MSLIFGVHYNEQKTISSEECESYVSAMQGYQIGKIQCWQEESICLMNGTQSVLPSHLDIQMPYDDRNGLVITADAIIDNRDELYQRLELTSDRRIIADAELILLAYRKWGINVPRYLIGDFAFVIWDQRKKLLFGARDLIGNRTLYIQNNGYHFAFSTMMKPLLALPGVRKSVRESWMAEFLAIPIVLDSVDSHSTVYADIDQIPAAHQFTLFSGKLKVERYGVVAPQEELRLRSNDEYEEAFLDVYAQAVRSRLITDRSIGATLSGGLDSGSVVSLAAGELYKAGKPLHTFSYIPPEDFVDWTVRSRVADERPFIRETVQHVGNIQDQYLDFQGKSPLSEMDDWLDLLEAPYKFIENSFWIKGIHEHAAAQGIGLLLTGARGNHTISWGSAIEYYVYLLKHLRLVKLHQELKQYGRRMGVGRKRLIPMIGKYAFPQLTQSPFSHSQPSDLQLIHPSLAQRTDVFEQLRSHDVGIGGFATDIVVDRQRLFETPSVMSMQGTSGTKLSLRYGVIERDPTCDPRVARFCLSLPLDQFVQNGMDRSLIRRSMKGLLPDKVRLNQRYRGVQGSDWLHRMLPSWQIFVEELETMCTSGIGAEWMNMDLIRASLSKLKHDPRPELAFDPDMRVLIRSMVVYRFLKRIG
ncbi:asparagine synthase (glutamine-hydrolysing) [Paenibacillus cellulosilyticus]|uniref:asparagine synthase (glutamine-hydrolyzing) n=1 Tax=Paenibacillus cellulosilyticus TaxID=375489 RepID=A0A2V2YP29_9BACL|nr:asparagine synthase-related protein [Paenibacillus cellulosilyticus]PWV93803.1 asparagine synthase (glutamine-hydrolysing) [Paenibacillus cellulosilyticus]QKS47418.1 asparagine synthetase B [Paenibacillus cellulosilyticus]